MKIKTLIQKTQKYSLLISIIWLCCTITGITLTQTGSLEQKTLFLSWAFLLWIWALLSKQQMFSAMQMVATVWAVLWFFTEISNLRIYICMWIVTLWTISYIIIKGYHKTDKFSFIWIISLSLLALWFATNPWEFPLLFNIFLATWGFLITLYSALEYFSTKTKIAIIFFVLNILFIIKPIIFIFKNI